MSKHKKVEQVDDDMIGKENSVVEEPKEVVGEKEVEVVSTETKPVKVYEVPSTKEDYLALYQCLKDANLNSIGDVEVKASKL